MIMPSQQGPPQQSELSLPLQHSIHCGATTNFNVKCLVYSTTVGSLHEFLFEKYKMEHAIFSNWWHIDTIREFPGIVLGKPGNGKWKKSQIPGNSRNRDPGFQTLVTNSTCWPSKIEH